jgi:hypothetical protein
MDIEGVHDVIFRSPLDPSIRGCIADALRRKARPGRARRRSLCRPSRLLKERAGHVRRLRRKGESAEADAQSETRALIDSGAPGHDGERARNPVPPFSVGMTKLSRRRPSHRSRKLTMKLLAGAAGVRADGLITGIF